MQIFILFSSPDLNIRLKDLYTLDYETAECIMQIFILFSSPDLNIRLKDLCTPEALLATHLLRSNQNILRE